MKHAYIDRKFSDRSEALISAANDIIEEYQADGYTLTLRQLYYQFVSRDLIPNKQTEYSRLGSVINDARLAGLIDWEAIEDRTRNLRKLASWDTPGEIINSAAESFRIDLWENQGSYCEVWIEKDALVGVIEPVCEDLRTPFFACRGYSSQSEQWGAGRRMADKINAGKNVVIFHLGDHDPSGIDMTRDNEDRLRMFIAAHADEGAFRIERLALNMAQVKAHKPPPNPAKMTDSRFAGYVEKYGDKSWELDALDPKVIGSLIRSNIEEVIDFVAWEADTEREEKHIKTLQKLAKNYS